MRTGKVSQTVWNRSIAKQMSMMRTGCCPGGSEQVILEEAVVYGNTADLGTFALARVVNELALRGGRVDSIRAHLILTAEMPEAYLKQLAAELNRACKLWQIPVQSICAEVSPVVTAAVVSITGIAVLTGAELSDDNIGRPGQDIILTRWIGMEGTLRLLGEREAELKQRFIPSFLNQTQGLKDELIAQKEIRAAQNMGVRAMYQIQEGGVLAALWNMAEASGTGLSVTMKKIPLRQETVEVCEFFRLNPYQMASTGSILMLCDDGEAVQEHLRQQGIPAEMIGQTTDQNERVLLNDGEKRYLDKPAPDEINKIFLP